MPDEPLAKQSAKWHYHRILKPIANEQDTWVRCNQTMCLWQARDYYEKPIWLKNDAALLAKLKEQDGQLIGLLGQSIRDAINRKTERFKSRVPLHK